jgi:rod shape-determining protein MreB
VQRRAVERALKDGGASKVGFVENAVAAAIGLGLGIGAAAASMVVDVGGGATDAGVLSLGGLVNEVSKPAGGTDIDKAIGELCIRSFDLVVSPATAEGVKMAIGTAWPETEAKVEVTGRDSSSGKARTVVVSASEVHAAIAGVVDEIISAAVQVVVTAPPDLANDLLACGLNLTGGAAELHGLARRLAEETGIPVHSSAEGGLAVVRGAARCLPEDKLFEASPKRRPARLSARPGGDR